MKNEHKENLWKSYVNKYPAFAKIDETVTLTTNGLKKLFDKTYDEAFKHGANLNIVVIPFNSLESIDKEIELLRLGGYNN